MKATDRSALVKTPFTTSRMKIFDNSTPVGFGAAKLTEALPKNCRPGSLCLEPSRQEERSASCPSVPACVRATAVDPV